MSYPVYVNEFIKYYHYYHKKDYVFDGHTHSSWEINIITDGELEVTYDDRIVTLKKNMLILMDGEVFHRNRVVSQNGAEQYVYHFLSDSIPRDKKAWVYKPEQDNLTLIKLIAEEAEKGAVRIQGDSYKSAETNYQAEKLLEVLLTRLINNENITDYEKHPEEKIYKAAVIYMKENIGQSLCIDEIAKECCVSNTKLKSIFNKFTGSGVIAHFSDMKINEAKKLLDKGLSIGEISERLGYSSQGYMSACFKRKVGMTPLKYKKGHRCVL